MHLTNLWLFFFGGGGSVATFTGTSLQITDLASTTLAVSTPSSSGLSVSGISSGSGLQVTNVESV